jgi:hypothetical protein
MSQVGEHRKAALLSFNARCPAGEQSDSAGLAVIIGLEVPDRSGYVDDWLTRRLASAPAPVYAKCRKGVARPTVLRSIDKEAARLELSLNSKLTELVEAELSRLLRTAGLKVLGSIRDPKVASQFAGVDLTEVARTAHFVRVVGGRTAMQISTVKLNELIEEAVERVSRRATELLEQADRDARDIIEEATLVAALAASALSVPAVIGRLASDFRALANTRLGVTPAPEPTESDIGERASGNVSPGLAASAVTQGLDLAGVGAGVGFASVVQRLLLGAPSRTSPNIPAVAEGRATLETQLIWRHAWLGKPRKDFPPHKALDGELVGSPKFQTLSVAAYERALSDGSTAIDPPFSVGGWHPQDHIGCVCGYELRTVLSFS